jgi:hypothetical protein
VAAAAKAALQGAAELAVNPEVEATRAHPGRRERQEAAEPERKAAALLAPAEPQQAAARRAPVE